MRGCLVQIGSAEREVSVAQLGSDSKQGSNACIWKVVKNIRQFRELGDGWVKLLAWVSLASP